MLLNQKSGPSELYSCQGRNDTDLSGRRIYLCFHPEPDAPWGILGTGDSAPWIFGGNESQIWVGQPGQVALYGHRKSQIFGTSDGVPPGRVRTIFHEHAGSIWVGGESGPSKFDNDRFRTLSQPNRLPAASIFGMTEDDDGYWWIATDVGVLRVPAGADHQIDGVM
jgi:ligand-binding sensor domain-containing protein